MLLTLAPMNDTTTIPAPIPANTDDEDDDGTKVTNTILWNIRDGADISERG